MFVNAYEELNNMENTEDRFYKNCLNCAEMHFKQDEFWDNDDVCICGIDNHYIGYPDEAERTCCCDWKML